MPTSTPSTDQAPRPKSGTIQIVRINDFCRALGIGRSTYYKLLAEGRLRPALKISKRARGHTQDYLQSVIADLAN